MIFSFIISIFTIPLNLIYWIKWITAFFMIRLYNAFHSRRFDLYDINALEDPVKLNCVCPQIEKELESPFPELHLQEAADEIVFYGINSKSECLLLRIARGCNQVADAWIYLKLANGKTYSLMETTAYQQPFDGKCQTFSCGKLQMHYLEPMRRWRIFFCGMLRETEAGKDVEDTVFVKFLFNWRASSDAYDCTLDTNPKGFATAMAKADWKYSFHPPLKKLTDALNMYAQTGNITGTVSVNDESDYEIFLFGEKARSLGKSANIVGCKFSSVLGNTPANGLNFHLNNISAPHVFEDLPVGFVVDPEATLHPLKDLKISIPSEKPKRTFKAIFSAGEQYEVEGIIKEPIVFCSEQGWNGYLELSFIEFEVKNKKGYGLIMTGEVYKEPERPSKSLDAVSFPQSVPLTVPFTQRISEFQEITGGKGSSLGKLTRLSLQDKTFIVPKGIVVTTAAYSEFLTSEILQAVKYLENVAYGNMEGDLKEACQKVSNIVENTELPNKICQSITKDLKDIFGDEIHKYKFAVRSSATGEDTEAMSAAGQMDTFLGIQGLKEIMIAVQKCWASQFGFIAVGYKRRYGQPLNCPMAVVIQQMVACEVSGVLFTCDPITNNPSIITITANYGLGETVVSGSVEPDTIKLRRMDHGELELDSIHVGTKHERIIMQDSGGTITEVLSEDSRNISCLSKELAQNLGKLSIQIESFYKSSRDIEWGIVNDKIYILQSRPVTNAAATTDYEIMHEFDAPLRCENEYFTVANVGEVMPGAMSILGMRMSTQIFGNTIKRMATEQGAPGNIYNNNYFDSGVVLFYNKLMMAVVEWMTRYGLDTPASKGHQISFYGRILDDPDLLNYAREKYKEAPPPSLKAQFLFYKDLFFFDFNIEKDIKKIQNYQPKFLNLETAKETFTALLKSCSDFDISARRQMYCSQGSSNWNMYIFRILWNAKRSLDNDVYSDFATLLATTSNVESANIPQAMEEVAIQIVKDIDPEKFRAMSPEEAENWLQSTNLPSGQKFRQFLERHGHRCLKEYDVRSITWEMDPTKLVTLLQNLAGVVTEEKKFEDNTDEIFSQLHVPLSFFSRCLLKIVLPNCRRAVRGREAAKSNAIKAINYWRKGFRRLAKQMVSEGRLPDEELLFLLTPSEIDDLLNTRSPGIISRANHRQRLFPVLDKLKFPEIMKGLPRPINFEEDSTENYENASDLVMKGFPVSQGVTKGYARVAITIEEASQLKPKEILITYSTDIAWSPYFPIISGVVTELGGLISHGAVVSREYGLPCVVGLQGATKRFRTGDYVLLDGKKGILQRLPQPEQ